VYNFVNLRRGEIIFYYRYAVPGTGTPMLKISGSIRKAAVDRTREELVSYDVLASLSDAWRGEEASAVHPYGFNYTDKK
jgi:hypothetical protein